MSNKQTPESALSNEEISAMRKRCDMATPGPWSQCGHDRGGCQCGQVWSETADHPIAKVEQGKWGDSYPAIRLTKDGIGAKAEAFMEFIEYGSIDESIAKANARFIAQSRTDLPRALDEIERLKSSLEEAQANLRAAD